MILKDVKVDYEKVEIFDTVSYGFNLFTPPYFMNKEESLLKYGYREVDQIENNVEKKTTVVWLK